MVTNSQTGDASKITYSKFASNLNEPLGVTVMGGEIYLLQKDQLSLLPDKNNDGIADEVRKVASGWTVTQPTVSLEFAMGMVYRDSVFYGGLATNWGLHETQTDERGCVVQMSVKSGGYTPYACGMRTPNGMTLGPDDEIFVTENQGNWVPSSKLLHIKKGHFYGVHKTIPGFFDKEPETPPAIWMDHGSIGVSPTQPVYMKSGTFKGQMIAGDIVWGTLQRYFLEKVGGEYQGAIFKFSGGLEAAANRIVQGPDGALYVGGIGTQEWGGWDWSGRNFGLQRMAPNGKTTFDLLAVRSMGSTSMELEFTTPVGNGADVAANYQVKQWFYVPELTYGAGKQATENLTVKSVKVSTDKLKVTLEITGMKLKNVVNIKLNGVNSSTGTAPWTTETWYTQNAFGPGTAVTKTRPQAKANSFGHLSFSTQLLGQGRIGFKVVQAEKFKLRIQDVSGHILETHQGMGPLAFVGEKVYSPGVYLISVQSASGHFTQRIVNP
ncbi:MAG: hypothetical protein M3Y08_13025 [Fibrobacterota bacterium]|nr:hypothetical protein [Fibrobacterota bacterium]